MGILARKVHRKPSIVKQLFIYLFICLFIHLFLTAILMLHGQLWVIIKGAASLTRC